MVTNSPADTNVHSDLEREAKIDCGGLALGTLMEPFAVAILAKAKAYRHFGTVLPPFQARWLLDSISEDIKKATLFHRHEVSVAAAEEARVRGVDNLSVKTRDDQAAFDPGRDVFVAEPVTPLNGVVYACLHEPTVEGVLDVLARRLRVVWLLCREAWRLERLGFRYRRAKHPPALVELMEPDEAYRRAGIAIVSAPSAQLRRPA